MKGETVKNIIIGILAVVIICGLGYSYLEGQKAKGIEQENVLRTEGFNAALVNLQQTIINELNTKGALDLVLPTVDENNETQSLALRLRMELPATSFATEEDYASYMLNCFGVQ